jgi:autotransporter-associated beta strand protein
MPLPKALALCIATALALCACGGGGGGGGDFNLVRDTRPPPTVIRLSGFTETRSGQVSDGSLTVEGTGKLILNDRNRFSGGTTVSGATLQVNGVLTSNVDVAAGGGLEVKGVVIGNVNIDGTFEALADPEEADYDFYYETFDHGEVTGDYRQSGTATMRAVLGAPDSYDTALLEVGRVATLGGTLQLGTTYFTDQPYAAWLIHANGGVVGQFARWTSPGLFISGSLRYAPNDVYFDVLRISLLQSLAGHGVSDPITLAGAAHLDRAFDAADDFAVLPRAELALAQRRFLHSAAAIQRIDSVDQAASTLDSLSGLAHANAPWLLLEHAARPAPQLSARLDGLQRGERAGAWSARPHTGGQSAGTGSMGVGYSIDGHVAGYDQWLGERVLLGGSFGWRNTRMQFDRSGGQGRDEARQASLYLRYLGDAGRYAFGQLGYDRSRLDVDRQLDLASGGRHRAHSQRDLDLAHVYAEAGRAFAVGHGRLVPYAALGYAALHGGAAVEQGDTGLELALQPWRSERITAGTGLRYARQWRVGERSWMGLDVDARYERALHGGATPLLAAFVGTPLAPFAIDADAPGAGGGWLGVGLDGGDAKGWSWSVDYGRGWAGPQRGAGWALGMKLDF